MISAPLSRSSKRTVRLMDVEDYGKELKGALLQVFRKYFGGIYEINKVELSNESLTADFFQFSSAITRC